MIALDTNVLIELEKGNKNMLSIINKLRQKYSSPSLPFPVFSEYYYGYLKKGRKGIQAALKRLEVFELLHSTKKSSTTFAEIKYRLEKAGRMLSDMDVLIAALCIDNGATLVTFDKQFEKVDELDKIVLEF